jgi:hypothetical protein
MDLVVDCGGTRRGMSGGHATTQLRSAGRGFNLVPPVRFTGAFGSSDRALGASEFTEERLSFLHIDLLQMRFSYSNTRVEHYLLSIRFPDSQLVLLRNVHPDPLTRSTTACKVRQKNVA